MVVDYIAPTSSRRLGLLGRRNFIRRLTEIGVSTSAIKHLDSDRLRQLTDDPTDRVPRLRRVKHTNHEEVEAGTAPPEREPEFYTISRDEWEHIEGSVDAMQRVDRQLRTKYDGKVLTRLDISGENTVSVGVREASETTDEATTSISIDDVRNHAPDVASGRATEEAKEVEVDVEVNSITTGTDSYYDHHYRSDGVPGGCEINSGFTLGTPAYLEDEPMLVTCAHTVTDDETVHQPYDSHANSLVGEVECLDDVGYGKGLKYDAAVIDSYEDVSYHFASDHGDDEYGQAIYGTYGWDGLKDGVPTVVGKYGKTTGHDSGQVQKIYENSNFAVPIKTFETTADRKGGDSGGPHYVPDPYNGNAYIAGIHRGNVIDREQYALATAMEAIEDHTDIVV